MLSSSRLQALIRRPRPPIINPFLLGMADTTNGHTIQPGSHFLPVTEKEIPSTTLPSSESQTLMADTAVTLADEVRRLREENDQLRGGTALQADMDEVLPPPYSQPLQR